MPSLNRRTFIRNTSGLLAVTLLAACNAAPRTVTGATPAATGKTNKLPTYIQVQDGPKPDVPPRPDGVDAGYFSFPQTLFKSVKDAPGNGEDVTLMTNLIQGAVVAL